MAISEAHVGRRYPATTPYEVSAAKIIEFAAALGDSSPRYTGARPEAPPTFVAVVSSPAWQSMFDDPELELARSRIVHADQRFRYARPLRAGDVITGALTVEKVTARGTAEFISVSVSIETVTGEAICTASTTFVHNRAAAA